MRHACRRARDAWSRWGNRPVARTRAPRGRRVSHAHAQKILAQQQVARVRAPGPLEDLVLFAVAERYDVRVHREPGSGASEDFSRLFGGCVKGVGPIVGSRRAQVGRCDHDFVHEQVHAARDVDQRWREPGVSRQHHRASTMLDPVPVRWCVREVVDGEGGHSHAVALVDDPGLDVVRAEACAGRVLAAFRGPDAHVEGERALQRFRHRDRSGWPEDLPGRSTSCEDPSREPEVRQSHHVIRMQMREEHRVDRGERHVQLSEALRCSTSRVEHQDLIAHLDEGARSESHDVELRRAGTEQRHAKIARGSGCLSAECGPQHERGQERGQARRSGVEQRTHGMDAGRIVEATGDDIRRDMPERSLARFTSRPEHAGLAPAPEIVPRAPEVSR